VMPSFNQSQFIEAAIESVLAQTFADLELIVMDGGSTDGTLAVLERMSLKANGRLRWFSERDRGASHAINKAFRLARAPIVGWLNSDDLYAPTAVENANRYFDRNPGAMMVYGVGRHIGGQGADKGEYPSLRPPATIEAFREQCFICQPTVFMRRGALAETGYLDENLLTAFDFDLWLRMFERYPGRIGFVDATQAYSRLHHECKTMKLRRIVALESMQVTSRALGSASPNWLYTYLDEFFSNFPHVSEPTEVKQHLERTFAEARGYLGAEEREPFDARLHADARLRVVQPDAYLNIYPDGWAPPTSVLRVRAASTRWRTVRLTCRHAAPQPGALHINVFHPSGSTLSKVVTEPGPFSVSVPLDGTDAIPAYWSFVIVTTGAFIPSTLDSASSDNRELAFLVEGITLET